MHTVQLVAVTADTATEAIAAVEDFLDGRVGRDFDSWAIGGRWSGLAGGRNVLCHGDDPDLFTRLVDHMLAIRNRTWTQLVQSLTGAEVAADELDGGDGSVPDPEAVARSLSAANAEHAAAFRRLLVQDCPTDERAVLIGWILCRLGELAAGRHNVDSAYWDAADHTAFPGALRERCRTDGDRQWLVVVDLHS